MTETPVRSSNLALYVALVAALGFAIVGIAAIQLIAALPEAARLVLIGTCPISFVVIGGTGAVIVANNLSRGWGERIATGRPPTPVIDTHYRELLPPPANQPLTLAAPMRALHYNAIPINYPPRRPQRAEPPSRISTNGITVEVDKLRKMLASPEPTRGPVQAMGAGIDNNLFASYRDFLIAHHVIDATTKPVRWAPNYPNEFTRDEWLIGLLNTSPTTAAESAEEY
jgi:hypothetical protein